MENRLMKNVLIAVGLVMLTGCAEPKAEAPAADRVDLKMYVLDCGRIEMENGKMFSDSYDYDGKPLKLVDSCYAIQHPKGVLVWDTGLSDGLVGLDKPVNPAGTPLFLSKESTLTAELAKAGIKPADVMYVGISHMHFDHSANAELFTNATLLVSKADYDHTFSQPTPSGFDPSTIDGFVGEKLNKLTGDYDVFGDGSVTILSMPGHTPGHQTLMLELPEQGTVLLSGDLYHLRNNYEKRIVPRFQYNRADYIASFDRMERVLKATDAKLIVQHDRGDFESLPKAPEFVR